MFAPNATLAGAEASLGSDDECAVVENSAKASWPRLGVSGTFMTLGVFSHPNGKPDLHGNGCTYRAQVHPDTMTASGPGWHTDRGLSVNDDVAKMYRLYPNATYHTGYGPEPSGWWLQMGAVSPGLPLTGVLIAYVQEGRVSRLRLRIGAEGE
jgi:hypothetical protein